MMLKRSAWLLSVALAWGLCSVSVLPHDAEGQLLRQPTPLASPQNNDESPDPFADDPPRKDAAPTIVTDDPAVGADGSTAVKDGPNVRTDGPAVVTEKPTILAEEPIVISDEPSTAPDEPYILAEEPIVVSDAPAMVTDEPAAVTDGPLAVTETPVRVDDEPIDPPRLYDDEPIDPPRLYDDDPIDPPLLYNDEPIDEPLLYDDEPVDFGNGPFEAGYCDSPDCVDPACRGCRRRPMHGLFSAQDWFVKCWIAQGLTVNVDSPNNRFNLPVTFNDRSNDYQMNQAYLAFGKMVDRCRAWDIGGRVDLLYGTDYFFTQAVGLELASDGTNIANVSNKWNASGPRFGNGGAAIYGLAMPQAYAEVLTPFAKSTSIKLGHFYTILGYESVMAPENFFYSHSYTMQYGQPRTHTGVLATTEMWPGWTFQYGMTRGWDMFEDPNSTYAFIGGATFTSRDERTSLSATVHTGNERADAFGEYNRTLYSLVLLHQISCRWTYVFQHDFGIEENAEIDRNFMLSDAKWYSVNQYLFCRLRDNLDFGVRVEWFRDQDNARVLGIPVEPLTSGGNYVATTFGLNWRPYEKVVLRPEIRWDWSDVDPPDIGRVTDGMFIDFTKKDQLLLSLDLIIDF